MFDCCSRNGLGEETIYVGMIVFARLYFENSFHCHYSLLGDRNWNILIVNIDFRICFFFW